MAEIDGEDGQNDQPWGDLLAKQFDADKLAVNLRAFVDAVSRAKPSGAKGTYMKKVSISSTMGPGVSVDVASATAN